MSNIPDPGVSQWVKSTYSGGEGGQCFEWSPAYAIATGIVPVRDSKNPEGQPLAFSPDTWGHFIEHAKGLTV
ncbi:DUF397 domain-containing protein [Streptomyces sp. NPDC004610]|uniref:DUF397 domain-containing protein n=1 Tax=unclassified Streptomyces TaxID=2593676 RepID=UPI0033A6C8DF